MTSRARLFENGAEVWSVAHESEKGLEHLEVSGEPPKAFARIRNRLLKEQAGDNEVDLIFDIPVELAASVCRFRHHEADDEQGDLQFTALRDSANQTPMYRLGRLVGRLLARR